MDIGLACIAAIPAGGGIWQIVTAEAEARRVAGRMAEGEDRFLDEQRSYGAYPVLRDPRAMRRRGWMLVGLGVVGLAFAAMMP